MKRYGGESEWSATSPVIVSNLFLGYKIMPPQTYLNLQFEIIGCVLSYNIYCRSFQDSCLLKILFIELLRSKFNNSIHLKVSNWSGLEKVISTGLIISTIYNYCMHLITYVPTYDMIVCWPFKLIHQFYVIFACGNWIFHIHLENSNM